MEQPYKLKRPKGLGDYILNHSEYNYLYFTKKSDKGFCTACRKEVLIGGPNLCFRQEAKVHNQIAFCPHCGEKVVMKEARYGRLGLEENGRILWFRKRGNITYAQLDEYDIDYTEYKPKIYYWPSAQYKFSKKETKYYRNTPCDGWKESKYVRLPSARHGMIGWWQSAKYEKTIVHKPTLENLGTDLQYQTLLKRIDEIELTPYGVIAYIDLFLRYPSIEVLEKSGFERFVFCKIDGEGFKTINWRKKKLTEIFRMPMNRVRELREVVKDSNLTVEVVRHYLDNVKRLGRDIDIELSEKIAYLADETLEMFQKYMQIEKAIEYTETQGMRLGDYRDYLEECEFLGMDLQNKKILKPANLKEAHEETSAKRTVVLNKELIERFRKTEQTIAGDYGFEYGNLFIRPASDPGELTKESLHLHHCVRTYIDKVALGKTSILFIREKDNPDESFYTLELDKNKEIVQVRGDHNVSMTEEVREFVEEWKKHINKVNKRKRVA